MMMKIQIRARQMPYRNRVWKDCIFFLEFYYTKHNYYEFFSGRFSSIYNGDIDLSIYGHRVIAKSIEVWLQY